ncbi:hypothetical protein JCM12214_19630 [Geobacillus vulcani]
MPNNESCKFKNINNWYTGTITAVIGNDVINKMVKRKGFLYLSWYLDNGYAANVAATTVIND